MADDTIGWLFVAAQAGLLVAIVVTPGGDLWARPTWLVTAAGVCLVAGIVIAAIAALGLGASLTPSPVPNAAGELQTTGLYGLVRHPVYSGVILALIGAALRSGQRGDGRTGGRDAGVLRREGPVGGAPPGRSLSQLSGVRGTDPTVRAEPGEAAQAHRRSVLSRVAPSSPPAVTARPRCDRPVTARRANPVPRGVGPPSRAR